MEIEPILIFKESAKNSYLLLRWLLVFICSVMILASKNLGADVSLAHALVIFLIVSNAALHFIPTSAPPGSRFYGVLGIVDIFFVTLALAISGQTDSDFYMMYFLIIIIAALSQDLTRVLLSTLLIVALYGSMLFATEYERILAASDIMLRLPFILIIALVYAHLVQRLRAETTQRVETAGLYQQSKIQAETQRVLRELNQDIATLDVRALMNKLTETVRQVLEVDVSDATLLEGTTISVISASGGQSARSGTGELGRGGHRLQKIMETRKPYVSSDVSRESGPAGAGATRYPGVRGYLGVPFLSRQGDVLGFLRALTYEPKEFLREEIDLLQQMANSAAIALENTRLLENLKSSNTELERSFREQRSLQEFLSNILQLDVDQVLQKLTEEAVLLFDADIAWIRVFDERGQIKTGAAAGKTEILRPITAGEENRLMGRGKWMLEHRKPMAVKDMASDSIHAYRGRVSDAKLRGFLGAPLLGSGQKPQGLIYVMTRAARDFTQREIHLIEQFANGAAIAMENSRLLQELRGKTHEQETTNRTLKQLLEEQSALREIFTQINLLDSNQLLSRLADQTRKLLRADHVQVRLLNEKAVLETVALAGEGSERFRVQTRESGKGRSTWIMENRRPMQVQNVARDMYFGPGHLMQEMGVKAYLGLPLIAREQRSIGVLIVTSLRERTFSNDEIALTEQLAAGAAIAIENARLFEQVREASKKIEEAFRTKTAFMNTMAHELRTPLNVILGVYELFTEGIYGELTAEQKDAWDRVRRNAQDLLNLIDEILDLVRLESKKVPLHIEEFSIAKITDELQSSFHPLARKKGVGLKFNVDGGDMRMKSDVAKLKEVIQNLLSNALKYTDQGEIELSASPANGNSDQDDKRIKFAVRDSGIGIKESDLPHLFEAFYMVGDLDRQKYPGTGLGLCIVQRLAELLGGDVRVQSELGKGSTFTVTLPLVYPAEV